MIIAVCKNQQMLKKGRIKKKRLYPLSSAFSFMALKTLELGRMGLLHFITLAGAVTIHTNSHVLYAAVEGVIRYQRESLSRKREEERGHHEDKYNKPNDTFHIYILSHTPFLVTGAAACFQAPGALHLDWDLTMRRRER